MGQAWGAVGGVVDLRHDGWRRDSSGLEMKNDGLDNNNN